MPCFNVEEDFKTLVTFTINDDNEVIVLPVDSKNKRVVSYSKAQLNYKKLSTKLRADDKLHQFKLPVHFKRESSLIRHFCIKSNPVMNGIFLWYFLKVPGPCPGLVNFWFRRLFLALGPLNV